MSTLFEMTRIIIYNLNQFKNIHPCSSKQHLTLSFSLSLFNVRWHNSLKSQNKEALSAGREHVRARADKKSLSWEIYKSLARSREKPDGTSSRNGTAAFLHAEDPTDRILSLRERGRGFKGWPGRMDRSVLDTFRTMAPNWSPSTGRPALCPIVSRETRMPRNGYEVNCGAIVFIAINGKCIATCIYRLELCHRTR